MTDDPTIIGEGAESSEELITEASGFGNSIIPIFN